MMKFIKSKFHGIMDYIYGSLLMASPWLLGFSDVFSAKWVALAVGALMIIYSMFTRYELGVWRVIPFRAHLWLDYIGGIFLIIAPWFFGFRGTAYMPFIVFGLIAIGAAAFSRRYAHVPEENDAMFDTDARDHDQYVPVHDSRLQHH